MTAARTLLDVLFASLWQDALIGICVAVVLLLAGRRLNAATRHVVLQAALVVMVILPVATTLSHVHAFALNESGHGVAAAATGTSAKAQNATQVRQIDIVLADRAVLWLVALWLAGAAAFLLRIALAAVQLRRIVRASERLADRGGAHLYASATIPVPVAFGLLKPAIVVPSKFVREGGDELECILLHELAHVHRRDAWRHTFERLVHAVLFFNPAVILLLRSLALEREAACDDWAVAHSHDSAAYTHCLALIAVRSSISAETPAACGAMGFGHAIVRRIARLEDRARNGSLLLSPFALGGFTVVLISVALSLQLLTPAIAFSPQATIVQTAASSSNCFRSVMVTIPAQPPGQLPAGKVTVDVSVSPKGDVIGAKVNTSSGNTALDRAAVKLARESEYSPAMRNCKPVAGTYLFMFRSTGV
jgi:TonB family protein